MSLHVEWKSGFMSSCSGSELETRAAANRIMVRSYNEVHITATIGSGCNLSSGAPLHSSVKLREGF
jgi:hypothetical protein